MSAIFRSWRQRWWQRWTFKGKKHYNEQQTRVDYKSLFDSVMQFHEQTFLWEEKKKEMTHQSVSLSNKFSIMIVAFHSMFIEKIEITSSLICEPWFICSLSNIETTVNHMLSITKHETSNCNFWKLNLQLFKYLCLHCKEDPNQHRNELNAECHVLCM